MVQGERWRVFAEGSGRVVWFFGRLVEECSATGPTSKSDNLGVDTPAED